MTPPARVLLVDDDATQLKLQTIRLRDAGLEVETASDGEEALRRVAVRVPDAIVSDVLMDGLDGFGLCRRLRADPRLASVPILLLSAHYRDQPDQALAEHVGASALLTRTPDFDAELGVLLQHLGDSSQARAVADATATYEEHLRSNANQLTKLLGRARTAEGLYQALFDTATDAISVMTPDGIVLELNRRWAEITGREPHELVGRHIREFAPPEHRDENAALYGQITRGPTGRATVVPIATRDGGVLYLDFSTSLVEVEGESRVLSIGRDVTEQVLATRRIAETERKYRQLLERLPDVVWTVRADGTVMFVTENIEKVLGWSKAELAVADRATRTERVHPQDRATVEAAYHDALERGTPFDVEYRQQRKDGAWVWLRNRATSYELDGVRYVEGLISDVTEHKRLEESFHHAQRMEAMGQLTGGIAHDFNNILCVILAMGEILTDSLGEHDPRLADAEEIVTAAERAAALTRQLLAFSRRQILEPTVVDVNAAIGGIEKMLRRLIGEDILLSVVRGEDVGAIRVDIGQLEQVIMNLAVNARDAMPDGGTLVIETSQVDVDEGNAAEGGAPPGQWVTISVTDSGCGMDADTRARIFEPFFTTKELGKGTGLGLATCYGIIKQSGGYIWAYSEPGNGSVFTICLPRVDATTADAAPARTRAGLDGHETILIVEDEERVRTSVARMLAPRGYRLLVAPTPAAAVELAAAHPGGIDLVLSDVVMPGGNGPTIVEQIQARIGKVRVLFMSGYTDHPLLRSRQVTDGVNFVQKPFGPDTLARKVRDTLDRGR